jgi:EAL domain-containing protein (putative c-di-GMP-specific phosphodiesterase class I)
MGCAFGQGYLMSRPLGADQASELIRGITTSARTG